MFKAFVFNNQTQPSQEEKFMTVCNEFHLEKPKEDGPRKEIYDINPIYLTVQPNHTEASVLEEYAAQHLFWDRLFFQKSLPSNE